MACLHIGNVEAAVPESATAAVGTMIIAGDELLELFDKGGNISKARRQTRPRGRIIGPEILLVQFKLSRGSDLLQSGEHFLATEFDLSGGVHNNVERSRVDRKGNDFNLGEVRTRVEEFEKFLPLCGGKGFPRAIEIRMAMGADSHRSRIGYYGRACLSHGFS